MAPQKPAKTIPGSLLNEKGPCVAQDPSFFKPDYFSSSALM